MAISKGLKKIAGDTNAPETGFGNVTNAAQQRLMNKDGSANVARLGEPAFKLINIYHELIRISWLRFTFLVVTAYVIVNFLFTAAYLFIGIDHIQGMIYQTPADKFWETFFFSAQTLTTVGYGRLNPSGMMASTLAACESFTGLMGFALATGLLYGRFSRPTAKILYSDNALISPYKNKRYNMQEMNAFMFRIANARNNQLIEIEAQVLFTYNQERNGEIIRTFQLLDLEIAKVSYLSLSWTIVHPITDASPMHGLSYEDLLNIDAEFMINIKAVDDGYSQQVYSRSSYKADEVVFNAKFVSAISRLDSGLSAVDLRKISEYKTIS
jgi:inward rectifier potassium channel